MSPRVDPALLKALSLDSTTATISKHGGSGFAETFMLSGTIDGEQRLFFVKTGGTDSEEIFRGEHASLNAIHSIVPSLCPKSHAHGPLESGGFFLATDFLDLNPPRDGIPGSGISLARKLAKLHSTPAPIPEGYEEPVFGFPVTTCCGETPQDNGFKESWAEFYGENRLRGILQKAESRNGADGELEGLVGEVIKMVVPRLLGDGHLRGKDGENIKPVVVHGDLWSGNHGRGRIGDGGIEEVVFDPSACWAHAEFEAGIMGMFGGFGGAFWREYHEIRPKDEPVDEWEDRCLLYELYHHLNHYAMFGGGYRGGAMSIMRRLLKKYGKKI
ncbi:fructosamine-3-kinase [Sclerotinia borealis F-4128]|uniref:protein-ribulosamine 3-kinase n=1 Tax=Sclerotinia borealis (strain F-4128) TaxID=1432307 RepID=W9CJN7_SCLBF|nr:fructosamine-3-kinase [Sclerotinia borealis F-4128]